MIDLRGSRFTDIMPRNLASQLETQAFAYAMGRQIEKLCAYADGVHIYAAVASIPEKILDVLAVELRTPAYNQDFPIEVKRKLVEGTLTLYAHIGTPAACNQIIETIFGNGHIEEWFEYGGSPHHFRIQIIKNHSVLSEEEFEELIRTVFFVKRLSSWLDEIVTTIHMPPAKLHVGGTFGVSLQLGVLSETDEHNFASTLYMGRSLSIQTTAGILEDKTVPEGSSTIHTGGGIGIRSSSPILECTAPLPSTTILRTGGVCTIISNLSQRG